MKTLPDLERRRIATAKTLAKYEGKPFDWRKSTTCLHLARFQMRAMGHKPPRLPPLRSALRAKKELDARGHASVIELLDSLFPRIAPAAMRLGDLAAFPGDPDAHGDWFQALAINVAPRKFAGWHPDKFDMAVMDAPLGSVVAAWRL